MAEGYPLYAEAVNEKGLYMAGLNFPGNACYEADVPEGFDAAAPVVRSVGAAIVSRCPHFFISREFFLHYITMREREKYFFAVSA